MRRHVRSGLAWVGLAFSALVMAACADGQAVAANGVGSSTEQGGYRFEFRAYLDPGSGTADVEIRAAQSGPALRGLDFNAPGNRYSGFEGDGEIEVNGGRVLWSVPKQGGSLRFKATINHMRRGVHDARITDRWAVLRLDDLFPAARTRAVSGAEVEATLHLSGPQGWSFETPYGASREKVHHVYRDRRFPRPVGWMVGGDIGVRRDTIADRPVAVAAPVGEGFRRQDTLAFLHWTLPALVEVFPNFSERLLIVGSGKDMWRGGLSAPASLYMHPHRPLISENATSTLLHELIHVATADLDGDRDDWLVEGIAEYYALELLRRTGGISQSRFDGALLTLERWAERENARLAEPSTGANTAFAVLVIADLAAQLQAAGTSMDELVISLLDKGLTAEQLNSGLAALGVNTTLPELPGSAAKDFAE